VNAGQAAPPSACALGGVMGSAGRLRLVLEGRDAPSPATLLTTATSESARRRDRRAARGGPRRTLETEARVPRRVGSTRRTGARRASR
jgi:hypothetical protein